MLILLSVLAIAIVPRWRPALAALVLALAMSLTISLGALAFLRLGWLIDGATPAAGAAVVLAWMLATSLAQSESNRRTLRQALATSREAQLRLEGEMDAARRIQMGMLPLAADALRGETRVQVGALMQPARTVGGDLYDFFMLDAARLFFLVGDVSGKGLPASLFMALSKAMIKSAATSSGGDPGVALTEACRDISGQNPEQLFVTVLAGVLDLSNGELRWCSAGHESPWLLGDAAAPLRLNGEGGPPLCVIDAFPYRAESLQLQRGQSLVLLTDGVAEAQNPQKQLYGAARLETCMRKAAACADAQSAAETIGRDVAEFTGSAELADDVTALVVRWL